MDGLGISYETVMKKFRINYPKSLKQKDDKKR